MDDIANKIKTQMELHGISYRELSEQIGISVSTLHYRLNSSDRIDIDFVEKIAPLIKTTPERLFGWDEEYNNIVRNVVRNELFEKKKVLFDMIDKVKPEDLDIIIQMVERLAEEDG